MRPLAPRNSLSALPRIGLVVLAVLVPRAGIAAPLPTAAAVPPANYARVCEPQIKPAFSAAAARRRGAGGLAPRSGPWRRAKGLTGHLDEYHPVFRDGWKGIPIKRTRRGARRHRLAARTVRLLARRRASAGLCPARRGPDQEDPRPARSRSWTASTRPISARRSSTGRKATSRRASTVGPIRRWAARWWRCTRAPATSGCSTRWSRCMPIIRRTWARPISTM